MWLSGIVARFGLLIDQHEWRDEKVPRSLSWPDRRTGKPFVEQRTERQRFGGRPVEALAVSIAARGRRGSAWIVLWTLKPSGGRSCAGR